MKKHDPKKLQLTTEKLALLSNDKTSLVAGGSNVVRPTRISCPHVC